jgi:head-tail adaptor
MAAKTTAGQLYERVAFDKRVEADDGYGNTVGRFAEQFQRRAGFTYLRGGEAVIAGRLQGRQPIVVRLRADGETRLIGADWQMRDARDGSVFAVRSIAETPDRRWLDIMVEQGVAA